MVMMMMVNVVDGSSMTYETCGGVVFASDDDDRNDGARNTMWSKGNPTETLKTHASVARLRTTTRHLSQISAMHTQFAGPLANGVDRTNQI